MALFVFIGSTAFFVIQIIPVSDVNLKYSTYI